jgi:hypothetical protein
MRATYWYSAHVTLLDFISLIIFCVIGNPNENDYLGDLDVDRKILIS